MQASEREALARLPVGLEPWEVALVDVPITVAGVDFEGLLVVASQRSGVVRSAGPVVRGQPLWTVLARAFREPASPAVPARPPRLLCADPALAVRLQEELQGLAIRADVVARLPAVEAVITALAEELVRSEPRLVDADCAIGVGSSRISTPDGVEVVIPGIYLKLRRRDAERVARRIASIDALSVELAPDGMLLHAWAGPRSLGPLVVVAENETLLTAERLWFCISGGGPTRPRMRQSDIVFARVLAVNSDPVR